MRIASLTRSASAGATSGAPLTTRETVARLTPATGATSFIVGRRARVLTKGDSLTGPDGVDPLYLIDDLRDPQVGLDAGHGQRVAAAQAELALDQREHRLQRLSRRGVEVCVEPERHPTLRRARER